MPMQRECNAFPCHLDDLLKTPTVTTIYQIIGEIPCLSCNCPPRTLRLQSLSAFATLYCYVSYDAFSQIQADRPGRWRIVIHYSPLLGGLFKLENATTLAF